MATVIVDDEEVVPTQYEEKSQAELDSLEKAVGTPREATGGGNVPDAIAEVGEEESFEIPSKFKGKTKKDILESYSNLEQELGRKGQEIGELRQLTDTFLRTQLENTRSQQQEEGQEELVSEVDFFEDPTSAVSRLIEDHPKFREMEAVSRKSKNDSALNNLTNKHPDYRQVITDGDFQQWVQKSPIRSLLFTEANDNYSVDAADELLSTWKALNNIERTQEVAELKQARQKKSLRAAHSEVATGSNPSGGKFYRKEDVIRLRINDPDRYDALSDDILKAYAEGRVR